MKTMSGSILVMLAVAAAAASAGASAQEKSGALYAEAAFAPVSVNPGGHALNFKLLRGLVGYEAHPNLAVEAMFGFGLGESRTSNFDDTKMSLDRTVGFFVRPKLMVSPGFEVFGRVGYTNLRATLTRPPDTQRFSESRHSFGVGAAWSVTPAISLVGDYMSYVRAGDGSLQGPSIGLRMAF